MGRSDSDQHIFDEIERELVTRAGPAALPPAVRTLIGLLIAMAALVIGVTLLRSEANGLTLLIGGGLLGAIVYLHH